MCHDMHVIHSFSNKLNCVFVCVIMRLAVHASEQDSIAWRCRNVCVCVSESVLVFVCVCVCVSERGFWYLCVCVFVYIREIVCVHQRVFWCLCACVFVYIRVCVSLMGCGWLWEQEGILCVLLTLKAGWPTFCVTPLCSQTGPSGPPCGCGLCVSVCLSVCVRVCASPSVFVCLRLSACVCVLMFCAVLTRV